MKKKIIAGLLALVSIVCLLAGCGGPGKVNGNVKDEDFYLYAGTNVLSDDFPEKGEERVEYLIFEGETYEEFNTSKGIGLGSTLEEVYEGYKDFGTPEIAVDRKEIEGLTLETLYKDYDQYCKKGEILLVYYFIRSGDQWANIDYLDLEELRENKKEPMNAYLLIALVDKEVTQVTISIEAGEE